MFMKTMNLVLACVVIFISTNTVFAQTDKLAAAFSKSYDYEKNKDYTSAITALKEVYSADSYETNLRLGWLLYSAGQNKESITFYKLAVDQMPYSIEAKFGYVYPLYALGNMDLVTEQYKKIIEIDSQNTKANYQLGLIYYYKKDYASAYKYFEKVVNLYPFGYDALLMYAWTNFQTGKTREAKILFNKVLMLSPGDTSALEGLGLIK